MTHKLDRMFKQQQTKLSDKHDFLVGVDVENGQILVVVDDLLQLFLLNVQAMFLGEALEEFVDRDGALLVGLPDVLHSSHHFGLLVLHLDILASFALLTVLAGKRLQTTERVVHELQ